MNITLTKRQLLIIAKFAGFKLDMPEAEINADDKITIIESLDGRIAASYWDAAADQAVLIELARTSIKETTQ